jgi:hypothetical protein
MRKKVTIPRVLLKPWARIGAHRVRNRSRTKLKNNASRNVTATPTMPCFGVGQPEQDRGDEGGQGSGHQQQPGEQAQVALEVGELAEVLGGPGQVVEDRLTSPKVSSCHPTTRPNTTVAVRQGWGCAGTPGWRVLPGAGPGRDRPGRGRRWSG